MVAFGSPLQASLAAASPPLAAVIGGDVALVAATDTLVLTTASLGVGTWALDVNAELVVTGAAASDAMVYVQAGSATCSFPGVTAADGELPALAGGSLSLTLSTLVVVTVAGTVQLRAFSTLAGTVKAASTVNGGKPVTGYSAVRVA